MGGMQPGGDLSFRPAPRDGSGRSAGASAREEDPMTTLALCLLAFAAGHALRSWQLERYFERTRELQARAIVATYEAALRKDRGR